MHGQRNTDSNGLRVEKNKSTEDTATECARSNIRNEIQQLKAYQVADPTGLIKLDAMENPYPWPEALSQAWREALAQAAINRYPDPQSSKLKQALRRAMNIPDCMQIMLGNGSDELIQIVQMAIGEISQPVLAPSPSFSMYEMIAKFLAKPYVDVSLQTDFSLSRGAMVGAINREQPASVFIAYPNNPSGNCFAIGDIEAVISAASGLVVIDEAYHAFCGESFIPRLAEFDNVVVMRTLSKAGLAGIRLGYLVGHPAWLNELEKVRLPYNINVLTQETAALALQHNELFERQAQSIREERVRLNRELKEIPDLEVYPSQTNFILFRAPPGRATEIYSRLKEHGVLLKNLHEAHPLLNDCLRVTVGTPEENSRFLQVLKSIILRKL